MELFAVFRLFIAHKVQVRNACYMIKFVDLITFASEFVNEFAFPVEHDMLLMLNGFFLFNIPHYARNYHLPLSLLKIPLFSSSPLYSKSEINIDLPL